MHPTFWNISHHACASWCDAQRQSALALLADGARDHIRDWPSRELLVDPTADTAAVLAQAANVADRALAAGVTHAMVAGEPVLTWHLVRLLTDAGVHCYAATTERTTREEVLPDGGIRKVAEFRFVRWREF
jgi:hypothetical protein